MRITSANGDTVLVQSTCRLPSPVTPEVPFFTFGRGLQDNESAHHGQVVFDNAMQYSQIADADILAALYFNRHALQIPFSRAIEIQSSIYSAVRFVVTKPSTFSTAHFWK